MDWFATLHRTRSAGVGVGLAAAWVIASAFGIRVLVRRGEALGGQEAAGARLGSEGGLGPLSVNGRLAEPAKPVEGGSGECFTSCGAWSASSAFAR